MANKYEIAEVLEIGMADEVVLGEKEDPVEDAPEPPFKREPVSYLDSDE